MTHLFQIVLVEANVVPLLTGLLATFPGAALFVDAGQITTDFQLKSVSVVSGLQGDFGSASGWPSTSGHVAQF